MNINQIMFLENFLNNLIFLVLFFVMIYYFIQINFSSTNFFSFLGKFSLIFSNFLLISLLILRWITSGHFPLSNLYESLVFLSWCFNLVQIFSTRFFKTNLLITITAPISLFIFSFATFSLPEDLKIAGPLIPALQSNWLIMHVSIMIFSYAFLLIGCLLAITFLIILFFSHFLELKEKFSFNNNFFLIKKSFLKVPILNSLDNLSYRTLSIGFFLLTLGILSGAVWANEAWGSYWSWDPKETWAFITWLVFAIYLHTRFINGWAEEKSALIATFGFFIVWICYLGVNLLGKGLHSYGWLS